MDGTQIGEFVGLNAAHFAAIVGLICNYRQEHASRKNSSHQDFVSYLQRHNHEQLVQLINNHAVLQRKVDELLRKDTHEIIATLSRIEDDVAAIRSMLNSISLPQSYIKPPLELTEQALWILDIFYNKQAHALHFFPYYKGSTSGLVFRGVRMAVVEPKDERYIRGDLQTLVENGFVMQESTGSKTVIYRPHPEGERAFRNLPVTNAETPMTS